MRQAAAALADRHPVLTYTAARLGLFLVFLLPLAMIGFRGLVLLGLAVLLSGGASLIILNGVRSRVSSRVSGRFARINERIDAATRAEDDGEDDARGDVRSVRDPA